MSYNSIKDKNEISPEENNKNQNNGSSNLYSVSSEQLTKEELSRKRKNESIGYILGILSQLVWALNSIQIKTYEPWFPKSFSNNSLLLWRSIPIWFMGYYFCKQKRISNQYHKFITNFGFFFVASEII